MRDIEKEQLIDTIAGKLWVLNEHDLQGVELRIDEMIRFAHEEKRQRIDVMLSKLEGFSKKDIGRVLDFLTGMEKTREKSNSAESSDIPEAGFSGAEQVNELPHYGDKEDDDEAGVPVESLTPEERRKYETEEMLSALRSLVEDDVEYLSFELASKIDPILKEEIRRAFTKFEKDLREQIKLEHEIAELKRSDNQTSDPHIWIYE